MGITIFKIFIQGGILSDTVFSRKSHFRAVKLNVRPSGLGQVLFGRLIPVENVGIANTQKITKVTKNTGIL